jgi:NADH:ubiquinone oxidoreductase subunit E
VDKLAQSLAVVLQEQQRADGKASSILRTLLAVQQALGYVPPDGIQTIARALEVTEADVAGVLSYYPDLRRDPPPRHVIRICMGESCVANHAARLLKELQERLEVNIGETSPDRHFALEQVFCLGNCAVGPTVGIDAHVYGRVTASSLDTVLDRYR